MQYQWTEWDEDVESTPDEEYQSLVRSLKRKSGFGLFFVRCSPAGGQELIKKIGVDVPQKQSAVLELSEPIANLIDLVKIFPNIENLKILFVVGLEKSLVEYIRSGYGGQGDYYNLDTVPPILSHLNWQRENFRDKFRYLSFVFLLPRFAIKYIIRRAPDFFDWGSGTFEFSTNKEIVEQESWRIVLEGDYLKYLKWSPKQRTARIIEIDEVLSERHQTRDYQAALLYEQGNIFSTNNQYKEAITSYDRALQLKPDFSQAWFNRGSILNQFGKYKESLISYERALKIDPNDYDAWQSRGNVLGNLGRYEEAIASYDRSLQIDPNQYISWYDRGIALSILGRYKEAILSFDKTLTINSNQYKSWYNRGVILGNLGRYREALNSYDMALRLNPNDHEVWKNRGAALGNLDQYQEEISAYQKALELNSSDYEIWYNQGIAFKQLGRYEEAVISFDKALELNPNDYEAWYGRGNALGDLSKYEDAIISLDKALQISPDKHEAYYSKACAYALQGNLELVLMSLGKAINFLPQQYSGLARINSDFDNIRSDPRFQELIQSEHAL
jgi:tetratricopeptide (TPR) repeat protein